MKLKKGQPIKVDKKAAHLPFSEPVQPEVIETSELIVLKEKKSRNRDIFRRGRDDRDGVYSPDGHNGY